MQDNHSGVLLEDVYDKLLGLAKSMSLMQKDISEMKPQLARVDENTRDLKTLQAVVPEHSKQLNNHEMRLQNLETMPHRA